MAVDLSVYGKRKELSDILYERGAEAFQRRLLERKIQADALRAQAGGDLPATIQIANEVQKALQSGDIARANLLMQVHKTLDKGVLPYGGDATDFGPLPGQEPPASGAAPDNQPLPSVFDGLPADDGQGLPDFEAENAGAGQGSNKPPALPASPQGGGRPSYAPKAMPGYGEAVGSIAATKKRMETDATNASDDYWKPRTANKVAQEQEVGKKLGETRADLNERVSRMPQLQAVTKRLSTLGKMATYTMGGRTWDAATRELGFPVRDAAQARTEYISTVDNEILPLLRSTFGAQFTAQEGESLKVTLGDPNKSPEEKDRVLKSFIRTKMETANSMAREVGQAEPFLQEDIDNFVGSIGTKKNSSLYEQGRQDFDRKKAGNAGGSGIKFLGFE